MAARQGPNIFSMKREKKDRDGVGGEGGTGAAREGGATGWGKETGGRSRTSEACFKLQQFCISHQENGVRFHCSDLMA